MNIKQLHTIFLETNSISIDTRKIKANDLFFALQGTKLNGNKFAQHAIEKGARFAIIDDKAYKTDKAFILVENVLESLQQLATYHRNFLGIKIIALTGSNGKTTTKELINQVLSKKFKTTATIGNLNNHIGVPLTLLSMNSSTEIGIVEMGANHLQEIAFLCNIAKPDYGYITNFGKAHLEGFGSMKGVIKGKSELFNYLKNHHKLLFINSDDKKQALITKNYSLLHRFGQCKENDTVIEFKEARPYVLSKFKNNVIKSNLIGNYNFSNISAAIAIGHYFKINTSSIKQAIENFVPTNNRSQIIKKGNNKIILDAYNANPTSMKAALDHFAQIEDNQKIAILGDMFELGNNTKEEHQFIVNYATKLNINELYLIGENFFETINNCHSYDSFESFTEHANLSILQNKTVLIKGSRGMALERILELF